MTLAVGGDDRDFFFGGQFGGSNLLQHVMISYARASSGVEKDMDLLLRTSGVIVYGHIFWNHAASSHW